MKRIKSESFAVNGNGEIRPNLTAQSPFNPSSVPAPSTSWMSSPPNGNVQSVSPSGPSARFESHNCVTKMFSCFIFVRNERVFTCAFESEVESFD